MIKQKGGKGLSDEIEIKLQKIKNELSEIDEKSKNDRTPWFFINDIKNKQAELKDLYNPDLSNEEYNKIKKIIDDAGELIAILQIKQIEYMRSMRGGENKANYKGREYKVHTGSKGGKYICVGYEKKKVYVK